MFPVRWEGKLYLEDIDIKLGIYGDYYPIYFYWRLMLKIIEKKTQNLHTKIYHLYSNQPTGQKKKI